MPEICYAQRTQEWHDARKGRITASLAAACLHLDPYVSAKAAWRQIVFGEKQDPNRHMQWGIQFEGSARCDFENETGLLVTETGFWVHPDLPWLGCSPDGLIGKDALCEIKCPTEAEPKCGLVPINHRIQMLIQLACTGRQVCYYYRWGMNNVCWMRQVRRAGIPGLIVRLKRFYDQFIAGPDGPVEPPRKTPKRRATKCRRLTQ